MKTCQRLNCNNQAIVRGKFCEIHRTNKKQISRENTNTNNFITQTTITSTPSTPNYNIQNNNLIEERKLKQEQDIEYQNTLMQDRLRIEENEYKNILKMSLEQFYIDKKNNLQKEPTESECYFIKIKIPNGSTLSRKFNLNSKIQDIRDYLDVYFYENKINVQNYNIVFVIPFKKLNTEYNNLFIKDITNQNKFMIHINDNDS